MHDIQGDIHIGSEKTGSKRTTLQRNGYFVWLKFFPNSNELALRRSVATSVDLEFFDQLSDRAQD
jgi:hypothetical protein